MRPLIALYQTLESYLKGWPDQTLTVALIMAAIVLVWIALKAPATAKAVALSYVIFP